MLQCSFSWESSQSSLFRLGGFYLFLVPEVTWVSFALQCGGQLPKRLQLTHASVQTGFYSEEISGNMILRTQNVYRDGVHLQIQKKPTPTRPYLLEICTTSREWVTFRPPDRSETQLFFLLASAERKEMEAGKWSWREPGRSEMRRASMCYRNGKRWRDKAHVKDTGNEKELQYFQPLVPGAHKDIAWPWQMELHMLAVKPHQTRLYVPSTCGLRITKSSQFGRNGVSMRKVSAGFMGFRSMTGRTTRPRLMYWTVAYIGPPRRRSDAVFFWKTVMRSWIK